MSGWTAQLVLRYAEVSLLISLLLALLIPLLPHVRRRYHPFVRCSLWTVLAVRLLIPFHLTWDTVARRLAARLPVQGEAPPVIYLLEEAGQAVASAPAQAAGAGSRLLAWTTLLGMVWLAGTACYLLFELSRYFHTARLLHRWRLPVAEEPTRVLFERLQKELGIRRRVGLYRSPQTNTPLLMGLARPSILLPESDFSPEELEHILRHELIHYRQGDLWKKLLLLTATGLHWYNPLVHWMCRQAEQDLECACDARALVHRSRGERACYGRTILSLAEATQGCGAPLTTHFSRQTPRGLVARFQDILTAGKRRGRAALALALALAGTASLFVGCGTAQVPLSAGQGLTPVEVVPVQAGAADAVDEPADHAGEVSVMEREGYSPEAGRDPDTAGAVLEWPVPGFYQVNTAFDDHGGQGVDIGGQEIYGSLVVAAEAGVVTLVEENYTPGQGLGIYLEIDHGDKLTTCYAQLSDILVTAGDAVQRGQGVARVGSTGYSTGPHLHFEVAVDGERVDPLDYLAGEETQVVPVPAAGFIWPTAGGYVSQGFQSYHGMTGIDIAGLEPGQDVFAAADGTVITARETYVGYGNYIVLDHGNGYQTLYAHNSELKVEVGDEVKMGQVIAAVGRTGNVSGHKLRFELRYNGAVYNPLDYVEAPEETPNW